PAAPLALPTEPFLVQAITAGYQHTCALTTTGAVWCWGRNGFGQLGDGSTNTQPAPVQVSGLPSNIITITAGDQHTCALTDTGAAWCWGYNQYGQLGDGASNSPETTPVQVSGFPSDVTAIAAGSWHTCALTDTGDAWCWGYNFY